MYYLSASRYRLVVNSLRLVLFYGGRDVNSNRTRKITEKKTRLDVCLGTNIIFIVQRLAYIASSGYCFTRSFNVILLCSY